MDNDQRFFRNILIFNKWREPGIWTGHNGDSFRLTLKCFKIPHFKCHKVKNLIEIKLRNRDKSNYLDGGTIQQLRDTPSKYFRFIYLLWYHRHFLFVTVRIIIAMPVYIQIFFCTTLNIERFMKQNLIKLKIIYYRVDEKEEMSTIISKYGYETSSGNTRKNYNKKK